MTRASAHFVDADRLRATVRFEDVIDPVGRAFQESSAGQAQNGLLTLFPGKTPEAGDVYVKSGVLRGHRIFLVKVSPWFAANVAENMPQGGFIAAIDSRTGHTRAFIEDEHYLSDIRTAAAGALAARALAPVHVGTALVLGSGVQAYWQALALHRERPYRRLLIWARGPAKAEALAKRLAPSLPGVALEAVGSRQAAVAEADVIIAATSSQEPLLEGAWLRPGQHITAVGADDPTKCELDAAVLRRARVFVDERATALANGDVARAIRTAGYSENDIAGEIGDVLSGRTIGRKNEKDITNGKIVGIGAQDLAACDTALAKLGLLQGA